MPKVFTRQLSFIVEGEIYDPETRPEDIIKNYDWQDLTESYDDNIHILASHKDKRGKITKLYRLSRIEKVKKKPDTEYFVI